MICVYDAKTPLKEENFKNNGLVALNSCKSCFIEEKLNDSYELTLEYPIDDRGKGQYLVEKNIIKADGQLFRIYHKEKTLTGITVNARHIFYDLLDNFLEEVKVTNTTGVGAVDWILNNTQFTHPFTVTGDVEGNASAEYAKKNVIEAIMSSDTSDSDSGNSVLSNYGGELERDNFTIKYWQHRGQDRGVTVRYGKNIVGIDETLDMDDVVTRIMPVGKDNLLLTEKYVDSPLINNYPNPIVREAEFSDMDDEDKLKEAAEVYIQTVDKPTVNYTIDFIELTKTEEYKKYKVLESVYMGDTVTIKHERLGIDLKAEVIRIKKNILTDRIEEVELGQFKRTLSDTFNNLSSSISDTQVMINKVNEDLTNQLDNKIESYYQVADPKSWAVKDNLAHSGDMWYKTDTKQLYRFNGVSGNWEEILNKDAIDAYEKASKAQSTADAKKRIFVAQPAPPYDKGDLWSQGKDGEILICINSKSGAEKYDSSDWELASKYTDDTKLIEFMEGVYKTDKANIQDQIDGAIETWFYNGTPSLFNEPSSEWKDDACKNNHLGDLYYDNDTGYAYRFALVDSVYQWIKITDVDVITALSKAKNAQDTADGKRRVFVSEPKPPYDIGDLWCQGDTGEILTCQNAKPLGATYAEGDFQKLNKYTDDTYAKNIQVGARNLVRNGDFSNALSCWYNANTANPAPDITIDNNYGTMLHFNLTSERATYSQMVNLSQGGTYTMSSIVKTNDYSTLTGIGFVFWYKDKSYTDYTWFDSNGAVWRDLGNGYKKIVITGSSDLSKVIDCVEVRICSNTINKTVEFWASRVTLSQGNKNIDWIPAVEDTQSQIDKAQKDANDAASAANSANKTAVNAITIINTMSEDAKLSPVEKQALNQTWFAIQSEKNSIDGEADHYGIDKTTYDNNYVALQIYITPLLENTSEISDIDISTFKSNFVNYYNAKNALLQEVAQRAKDNLDNLEIGGTNLASKSKIFAYNMNYTFDNYSYTFDAGTYGQGLGINSSVFLLNAQYVLSFCIKCNSGTLRRIGGHSLIFDSSKLYIDNVLTDTDKYSFPSDNFPQDNNYHKVVLYGITKSSYPGDSNLYIQPNRGQFEVSCNVTVKNIKLELGNKATDWSPAPEDIQKQIDDNYSDYKSFVDTTYKNDKSSLQQSIEDATATLNSALGGYALKRNGEFLVMDTPDVNTATKLWRWNENGLGYSSTGYNGQYATAITADGHINANFINTGQMGADIIKVGVLESQDKSLKFNLNKGEMTTLDNQGNYTTIATGGISHHMVMSGIRYIRVCGGSSTANINTTEWVSIKAYNSNNIDVAHQKDVSVSASIIHGSTSNVCENYDNTNNYLGVALNNKTQYITVDLGVIEEVKSINIRSIWDGGRVYKNREVAVSQDGSKWTNLFNSEDKKHRDIRYIRDWLDGSSVDNTNDWVEIQAINSAGQNVAQGKNAWGSMGSNLGQLTDGNLNDDSNRVHSAGLSYVVVDLGEKYSDIQTLKVFHYYGDRTYHGTRTEVSEDGVTWYSAWSSALDGGEYFETGSGHSIDVTSVWNRYSETGSGLTLTIPELETVNIDSAYHYLAYNGVAIISDRVSSVRIYLPVEFVGKKYKVTVSPMNIVNVSQGYMLKNFMCNVSQQNYDWFEISGYCNVCNSSNWNADIKIDLAVSYTIIA